MQRNVNFRPLVPRLLSQELSGREMVQGTIINRFASPVARLVNLPDGFVSEVYSLDLINPDDNIEESYIEDAISYTALASVKYETTNSQVIYLTTLLLSKKASELEYRLSQSLITSDGTQPATQLSLGNGAEAGAFYAPNTVDAVNQIVFIKDEIYYITVASNISLSHLSEIISAHLVIE